ncbi:MAG: ATP-binding protein [Alphaproteobacteria bacterium]|nr:ATP-binding protein [Alphaproteobacteria bacterium]
MTSPAILLHVVAGSTGAGKTTFAMELAARTGALRLSIDEWMHRLFGPDQPAEIRFDWMIERVNRCEAQMWSVIEGAAKLGVPVVADCGFTSRDHRTRWRDCAVAAGIPAMLHHVDVGVEERWRRVEQRNREKGPSFQFEVTREMFDFVETMWEAPTAEEIAAFGAARA